MSAAITISSQLSPKCGTVQEMRERAGQFTTALIMQSVWDLEDYGDTKAIKAMKGRHNLMTRELTDKVKEQGITGLTMSAGPTAQDCCMSAYLWMLPGWQRIVVWFIGCQKVKFHFLVNFCLTNDLYAVKEKRN